MKINGSYVSRGGCFVGVSVLGVVFHSYLGFGIRRLVSVVADPGVGSEKLLGPNGVLPVPTFPPHFWTGFLLQ